MYSLYLQAHASAFNNMMHFNAPNKQLVDSKGNRARRDNVHFVMYTQVSCTYVLMYVCEGVFSARASWKISDCLNMLVCMCLSVSCVSDSQLCVCLSGSLHFSPSDT